MNEKATTIDVAQGPFRREDFKIVNAHGRTLARLAVSTQIPTDMIHAIGDLLASSWSLRELLRHALSCSGSPADCGTCKEAANLSRHET